MENPQRLDLPRMPYKGERLGIIVGMLLGDASIVKKYQNNIVFHHTTKVRDYFDWKCDILSLFGYEKKKVRGMKTILDNGKEYYSDIVDFVGKDIKWFYQKAYNQNTGKRMVNPLLVRHLNQYGLAIWFMDDGDNVQKKKNNYYRLNTQSYTEKEHYLLIKLLKRRFGLEPSIHKDGNNFKLYFGAKNNNAKRLCDLVSPYIHPCFEYKLRWTPKEKVMIESVA